MTPKLIQEYRKTLSKSLNGKRLSDLSAEERLEFKRKWEQGKQ